MSVYNHEIVARFDPLPQLRSYPLKMPGCKRQLAPQIWELIPKPASGYVVVPFFGTGADSYVFYANGLSVLGSDACKPLVDLHNDYLSCYKFVRDWIENTYEPERIAEQYVQLRASHNESSRPETFYLLTRLAFNGLVRHNRSGGFNAPVGSVKLDPLPYPIKVAVEHSNFVRGIDGVEHLDFRDPEVTSRAVPGTLVYFDPIYLGTFDGYTGQPFDHSALWAQLESLTRDGVQWAISNPLDAVSHLPDDPRIKVHMLERSGAMNSDASKRGKVGEILVTFDPNA